MSDNGGILTDGSANDGRLEVHYRFPGRGSKYYLLTSGSGYPSAEFHFPITPDKRQLVPESGKSSANVPSEQ